jgi:N4-gp56 family major capsid protein
MATTTTQNLETAGKALGIYFDTRVIESLQPHLYFEQFGTVETVPEGNYTSRFFTFNKIATSSVSQISSEGAAPTAISVSVNAIDTTPTQYGVSVEMTDLVALTAVFQLVNTTLTEVGKAMARKIDEVIQTVVNAGSNVIYPNASYTGRGSITSSDLITVGLIFKAVQKLRNNSAPEYPGGGYACVMHPAVAYDLMTSAGTGASYWEMHKYAQPENLFNGEIGAIAGARIVQSPNVQTFTSGVTVYPTTLIGADAYRISYWLARKVNTYVYPPENAVSIANQLGQKGWVGAKTNIGVARTQEERLIRIESAATGL